MRTRRYAGPDATDAENNAKMLGELAGSRRARARSARYRCVLVRFEPGGRGQSLRQGTFEGRVALAPRGSGGFGYDPIFEPDRAARRPDRGSAVAEREERHLAPRQRRAGDGRRLATAGILTQASQRLSSGASCVEP